MSLKKEILVISYKFPPMGGVGTRRWAKFSKYLSKRNYHVNVITAKYPFVDKVNWLRDIKDELGITVHPIKCGYPLWLLKQKRNILEKYFLIALKRIYHMMNPVIDMAQNWGVYLLPYAAKLIRERNIKNVIASGPPSTLLYWAAMIKAENPGINLILDYRDPWNSHRKYQYGRHIKKLEQKKESLRMEQAALEIADRVLVVSGDMKRDLERVFRLTEGKVVVVNNGYDPDDFNDIQSTKNENPLSMIYTGELGRYKGARSEAIEALAIAIEELNDEFINSNLKVNIYSEISLVFFSKSKYYKTIEKHFAFHKFVPASQVPGLIAEHKYCLSINSKGDPHAFGTKIFDYMALGKKVFHISGEGELSGILKEKGQFVSGYSQENIKDILSRISRDARETYKDKADFSEFSLGRLTDKLEGLLG